ncbi:MAG: flippase-like domain-containing protein [Actinomycetota bacterium]|nr:flippase-like domain-containing protein [Actinomycetota bacterium]
MTASLVRVRASHPRLVRVVRLLLAAAVVGLVVWLVLVPEFGAARDDFGRLGRLPPTLVALAAVLEVASLLSYSVMTSTVLRTPRLPYRRLLAIDLADLAANHTLPGGGATAGAIRYRLFRGEGVAAPRALGAATIEIGVSNVALGLVFATGAIFTIGGSPSGTFVVAGVVAVVLIALAGVAGWALVRHPDASRRVVGRVCRHIPLLGSERPERFVGELSAALTDLISDRRRAVLAVAAALANWILDAAALWVMLAAFGQVTAPAVVLTAYGIGTILAQLPLTPGGLGIVEGATTIALVGLGVGHGPALLAVLGWRVLEFWLPTPVGWLCYLYLRARTLHVAA